MGGRPPRTFALGVGALALAVAQPAGLACAAPGRSTGPEPVIRVLLKEAAEVTLRDSAPGARETHLRSGRGALWVDGRRSGDHWRLPGAGVVRADRMRVRGSLAVHRVPSGLQVVNEVGLEDYVAGTLGREIYPGWDPETLKAQAVVARTYALHQRERSLDEPYHVGSGTGSQVYGGVDAETPSTRDAVAKTRGQYLADADGPILAVYHSASGGLTAASEEVWGQPLPYLVSVEVEDEEDSPDTYWRATISGTKLGRAVRPLGIEIGTIREVQVVDRSSSGRALRIQLRGERGSQTIDARALRAALGESVIRSTLFEVRNRGAEFAFVGSGHGHGVGMSQWGAQAMAQRGADYREILARFYPGASLVGGDAP